MQARLKNLPYKRDFYAGGLVILLGLGTLFHANSYSVGDLMHMGPGFFPMAIGVLLVLIGVLIAGTGVTVGDDREEILPARREWLGWTCITASPLAFILLGEYAGMAPATFGCVFIAALGDRSATLKSAFILSAVMTLVGVVLFAYLLQIPFPIFRGVFR